MNFRSLNCETNTRQLYGLLTGAGSSSSSKNAGRPWSNTATLAPKRVTNKVPLMSLSSLNAGNQLNAANQLNGSNQLNGLIMNPTSLINIQNGNNQSPLNGQSTLNGLNSNLSNNLNNSLNNSLNSLNGNQNGPNAAANQRNANNKGQQTLPTIYESNHYKETDLQTLFNNYTSKNDDRPPLPPDPPPSSSSSSYSNCNKKLISFNGLSSASIYHHQPSAVLKQLPTANDSDEETTKVADKSDAKPAIQSNSVQSSNTQPSNIQSNNIQSNKTVEVADENMPDIAENQVAASKSEAASGESVDRSEPAKPFKIDNLQTKFEEEITIYQRPVPLPGRLMKSSSLEDLFKIRVCKLNPLCLNNDPSKAIIFCANPGPLAKIKQTGKSSIESPNHNKERPEKAERQKSLDEGKNKEDKKEENHDEPVESDALNANSTVNSNSGTNQNEPSDTADDQGKENGEDSPDMCGEAEEDKNSLNTAIAASFKGFLGDLQACKQHQLALSTFRPLSNTGQHSTGITGTPNTSSTLAKSAPVKPDPAVEQINTMPNPFSFTNRKQSITSQSSQSSQDDQPTNQLNKPDQPPDITDLLKEFDVCFGDDGANDLISFSGEANRNSVQNSNHTPCNNSNTSTTNVNCTDQLGLDLDFDPDNSFNLPPPPPSLLNSTNSSVNVCPPTHLSNSTSNGCTANGNCFSGNGAPHAVDQQQSNQVKPSSNESYNESFAKLLDQTALKKASLGPATLETCGSKIQLTELDLSEYCLNHLKLF